MKRYDVAVIGAGVFGAWIARQLATRKIRVLLAEAWGPGHSRSSSGDETRILRVGYGAAEIYTRMAMRSLPLWLDLFARRGQRLFFRAGALRVSREDDEYSIASLDTLARLGAPHEIVPHADLARRWPQFRLVEPGTFGLFEPESGALLARRAVAAVVKDAREAGADFEVRSVSWPDPEINARQLVFACGPWLPKIFPDVLGRRISVTRQEVFYFAPPAGDTAFDWRSFPVWTDFTDPRGPYGVPDIEGRGIKVGFDLHGEAFDPDTGSRLVSRQSVERVRRFLAERFPALRDAPLTETRVCQYESTSTGDLLIDQHPAYSDVWLVGGGSGHGFKHGPAVGEYVAARLMKEVGPEPRFALATKSEERERAVY